MPIFHQRPEPHALKDEREKEAVRLWCDEHDLKVVDEK